MQWPFSNNKTHVFFIYLFYFFYQIVLFGPVFGPGIAKKRVLQH